MRRTKIVATRGPASSSPEVIRRLINAGMDVARLNFSHGSDAEHARNIATLRSISADLERPVTILQDLQGPKIRVGILPGQGGMILTPGAIITIVPEADFTDHDAAIPIDYPDAAAEARPGMRLLLSDGSLELEILEIAGRDLRCRVIEGGLLQSRAIGAAYR